MTTVFKSLLRADFTVQWRNRRASLMTILMPLIILAAWHGIILKFGGPFVLATCLTFGIVAVGLMGYSNTTARDREKGVFQRLRTTPATTFNIMASRLVVQLTQIAVIALFIFIAGYVLDKITLNPVQYLLALVTALISGAVYLGLGQALVGLISSAETLNSVTRLVYMALVALGAIAEFGVLGQLVEKIVQWSPYGTVQAILAASMKHGGWTGSIWLALAVTLGYAVVFVFAGIKWFKWSTQ